MAVTAPGKAPPLTGRQARLVGRQLPRARRQARRQAWRLPRMAVEDVEQEVVLALARAARSYDPVCGPWKNYAARAVHNHIISLARRQMRACRLPAAGPLPDDVAVEDDPGHGAAVRDMIARVEGALEPADYVLLWLHYAMGVPMWRLGCDRGMSPGAVGRRIASALAQAREALGAGAPAPERRTA